MGLSVWRVIPFYLHCSHCVQSRSLATRVITFWTLLSRSDRESNLVSYTGLTVSASSVGWRESKNQYRRPTPTSAASLACMYVCVCFYQVLESCQRRLTSVSSTANLPISFITAVYAAVVQKTAHSVSEYNRTSWWNASYSGSTEFKSRHRGYLSWSMFSVVFVSASSRAGIVPKIRHFLCY